MKRPEKWLAGAALWQVAAAPLLVSIWEIGIHQLLSAGTVWIIQAVCMVAGTLCIMRGLRAVSGRPPAFGGVRAVLWLGTDLLLCRFFAEALFRYGFSGVFRVSAPAGAVLAAATGLFLLAGLPLTYWVICAQVLPGGQTFPGALLHLLKRPRQILTLLAAAVLLIGTGLLANGGISWAATRGITAMMGVYLLQAFLVWSVCVLALGRILPGLSVTPPEPADGSGPDRDSAAGPPPAWEQSEKIRPVSLGLALLLLIIVTVFSFRTTLLTSRETRLFQDVDDRLREGNALFLAGQTGQAVVQYQCAAQELHAMRTCVSPGDSAFVYREDCTSPLTEYLRLCSGESAGELERRIQTGDLGIAYYPALLAWYGTQEELSEEQEILRDAILRACITTGETADLPSRSWIDSHALAINVRVQTYEDTLAQIQIVDDLLRAAAQGSPDRNIVEDALAIAEANPDDIFCQYAAMSLGAEYRVDGASHYEAVIRTAERYDALLDETAMDTIQIANHKSQVADAISACYAYDRAIPYYEAVYDLTGAPSDALKLADCCEKAGDYAACLNAAEAVVSAWPENLTAQYLIGLSALKTGDTDRALEAAAVLADHLQESAHPTYDEEQLFYNLVQYMTMDNSTSYTDYRYAIYGSLTERQLASVKEHPYLWSYMTGLYSCFETRDYETAIACADEILAVHEDLAMAWYLKGAAYTSEMDLEDAKAALMRADEIRSDIPAVLYALANVCDGLEEYGEAYEYCSRILALIPYQDHGNDIYGIQIHTERLMNSLAGELGR